MLEDAKLTNDEQGKKKVSSTQFTLNGVTYAASLFWQQLQNAEDPLVEIKEAASGVFEGSDLYCVRPGRAPQFGICVSNEGYKNGDTVAAIAVASALSDKSSFMAVFKVSRGWWYICVRNDIILADGDALFLNETDAKDQFYSMLNVPDWDLKIAPKEWNVQDAEDTSLESLLSKGLEVKLKKINALRGSSLILTIVGASLAGIWLLYQLVDFVFNSLPKKPVVQPVKMVEQVQPVVTEPPEVKPWEQILDPTEIMTECYKGAQALVRILPPGWTIEGITCTPSSITTSWRREIGRVLWIDKALDMSGLPFSSRSVSPDGSNLIASLPIKKISTINSTPVQDTVGLTNTINDLFQAMGQTISLKTASYTSPKNNVYNSLVFSFSSNHDPLTWLDLLIKFPGLEIHTIRYDINSKIWQYEGAIYVL